MKILWISNILFPEASALLEGASCLKGSGGWLLASAKSLIGKYTDLQLCVATVSSQVNKLKRLQGEQISYYVLPIGSGNQHINHEYERLWKLVQSEYKPDIVHIHGTEYSQGLAFLEACGTRHAVISIQGMTCAYQYYHYGISITDILNNLTFSDLIFRSSLFHLQRKQKKCSMYEKLYLEKISHVIGRTSWDRAHTWAINPHIKYHFCNETLRNSFYTDKWTFDGCTPHTIFLSQAGSPIKGLQQVIKALPHVIKQYPDVQVRIGGFNPTKASSFHDKIRLSGFGKYLINLAKKYKVADHIHFLGALSEEEMKNEYLHANLFVMPSAIENSPNSLGEAQLLGVPCIVSYVGGVHDMVPNTSCGDLYRFEEVEMLAYKICQGFETSKVFDNTVEREEARKRHDSLANTEQLYNIYKVICNE